MSRGYSSNTWAEICAFWGIVIAVALLIVTAFLNIFGASLGMIAVILDLIAKMSLLIAVAGPAYAYVRYKKIGWKVTYWVALVLYIIFIVFPVVYGYIK